MSFNIFGPTSKDSIRVGYISTDRGFVDGVSICEANDYAKLNPGTQFIFKTRNFVKYLNINEVNNLTPSDLTSADKLCEGIKFDSPCGPPQAYFYGGGGVGVQGNVVIGQDGAVLAVDLVSGGFGYQYPPIVEVSDKCGIGAGAVTRAILGEVVETVEYYDQEGDFEDYEICEPTDVGFGLRYDPNGKIIGDWDPTLYANLSTDPIAREIKEYQDFLRELKNPWWSTRKEPPLKLTSENKVTRTKFDVTFKGSSGLKSMIGFGNDRGSYGADNIFGSVDYDEAKRQGFTDADIRYYLENDYKAPVGRLMQSYLNDPNWGVLPRPTGWNEFMNSYAISPVPASNVKGSDFAGIPFTFEWEEDFPYDGEYVFRGLCDNKAELYLDNEKLDDLKPYNDSPNVIKKTVKSGVHRIRLDLLNKPILEKVKPVIPPVLPTPPAPAPVAAPVAASPKRPVTVNYYQEGDQYFVKVDGPQDGIDVVVDFIGEGLPPSGLIVGTPLAERISIETEDGIKDSANIAPAFGWLRYEYFNIGDSLKSCKFKTGKKYKLTFVPRPIINQRFPKTNITISSNKQSLNRIDSYIITTGNDRVGVPRNYGFAFNLNLYVKDVGPVSIETTPTPASIQIVPTSNSLSSTITDTNRPRTIFNTVDYINKADRKLWRYDPKAGRDSSFINQYGILPFNPNSEEANSNNFGGTHTIIWDNIDFPTDGNYIIEVMVDDDVTLYIDGISGTQQTEQVVIQKQGFSGPGRSTGKSTETKFFKAGKYKIRAELVQTFGPALNLGNPMALAVNIQASITETEVVSPKSWNENPMGVALTIDAPLPPIPQEPIVQQEGRCPNNPIWSTRFPGSKETWWPVNFVRSSGRGWSKFMNRYAISPVPPLSTPGSSNGGVVYRNEWDIEIPYDGFYALKSTVDEAGRILIDNVLQMQGSYLSGSRSQSAIFGSNLSTNTNVEIGRISNSKENNPESKKIFLTKGNHKIQVEVENAVTETFETVEQKIFSTDDWLIPPPVAAPVVAPVAASPKRPVTVKYLREGSQYFVKVDGPQDGIDVVVDFDAEGLPPGQSGFVVLTPLSERISIETEDGIKNSGNIAPAFGFAGRYENFNLAFGNSLKSCKFKTGKKYKLTFVPRPIINQRFPKTNITISPNKQSLNRIDNYIITTGNDRVGVPRNYGFAFNLNLFVKDVGPIPVETTPTPVETTPTPASIQIVPTSKTAPGVLYEGPTPIACYRQDIKFISPLLADVNLSPNEEIQGKSWVFRWSNVNFPETGQYTIEGFADDSMIVKVDGVKIDTFNLSEGPKKIKFNATKGRRVIEFELTNIRIPNSGFWTGNPTGAFLRITKLTQKVKDVSKSWIENPMGISAILIPPPCPKRVRGRGVVTRVEVDDPGNGYPRPGEGGYPVSLRLDTVNVTDPGINYLCGQDPITITPDNGAILDYQCDTFGRITGVTVRNPGLGFTSIPEITIQSQTGINATFSPQFEVVRDPIVEDPTKLIQVTDLVGLKQTGYVDGRPYYGAVFYKEGVRYAGFYETPGRLLQVYDTLQESIDAQVTTPPDAIQRQGTDVRSNNPRLNIPGTPENLI